MSQNDTDDSGVKLFVNVTVAAIHSTISSLVWGLGMWFLIWKGEDVQIEPIIRVVALFWLMNMIFNFFLMPKIFEWFKKTEK